MLFKEHKTILHLFFFALASYIVHKAVFIFFDIPNQNFHYSIELLYFIFFVFATALFMILLKFKTSHFDNIGMLFMGGTFIQMFFFYFILRPILVDKLPGMAVEKINFFITFILFLLFETLLTIRLLNKKR
ncbi:hypothetical protein SAMN05444397_105117 [Flavobacterium aquidurense]|uniref:Uncharacterized protein n=1 Tax=Flavobacterium frigidimaris TaxID=262320 RepID=A0ABX4BUA0_FLAFR|nr:hypothetical protein B0A65_06215 [Flavobacterium frigidimaris]SDZ30849.1 hypothetical protein SAMN05444397_105117 [Flavobacterium aquidurense]